MYGTQFLGFQGMFLQAFSLNCASKLVNSHKQSTSLTILRQAHKPHRLAHGLWLYRNLGSLHGLSSCSTWPFSGQNRQGAWVKHASPRCRKETSRSQARLVRSQSLAVWPSSRAHGVDILRGLSVRGQGEGSKVLKPWSPEDISRP